jgi:hypothetical protein
MGLADDRASTDRIAVETSGRRARLSQAAWDLLQFTLAVAVAAVAAYAIWSLLPEELDVRTDIVGYPIHSNFNVDRYYWRYWLLVGFVPLATLAVLLILRKAIPGGGLWRRDRSRELAVAPQAPPSSRRTLVAVAIGRTLFVGAIFGLEAAIALSEHDGWLLAVGLPVTVGYAVFAVLAAWGISRALSLTRSSWHGLALTNSVAIAFCVAGLYPVSRSTEVAVATTGEIREYPWFPAWLAAGLTGGLLVWVLATLLRARVAAALLALERRLVLLVAGPVTLLLFIAALPGALGPMDMFHEGEFMAAARMTEEGAFPWRDFAFIHGLFADVIQPVVGFQLFEDSRWGSFAGTTVVITPIYWISIYYLCAYLFRHNWLFLAGTQLAVILGVILEIHWRFILMPFILLLLAALLSRPSTARAVAFTTALFVQTVVTPEAGIAVAALAATLVLFELYYYRRARRFLENFRRTFLCAATGIVLSAALGGVLAGFGALDEFVATNLASASDHQLTGGIPVNWTSDRFRFAAAAPVALVAIAVFYFALQTLRGGALSVADWVIGANALFVALYYHKFLARADEHVFHPYAVSFPLLFYVLYRLVTAAEDGLSWIRRNRNVRLPSRLTVTALSVCILLVYAPLSVGDVVSDASARLHPSVPDDAQVAAAGYTVPGSIDVRQLQGLRTILDTYLAPGDGVFDFTNSPALFHYLLDRPSPTRYYHVSMAIREDEQNELVEELADSRPPLVVFESTKTGLPTWDSISNQIRHYEVSQYLLDYYRPLIRWDGFTFLGLKGADFPPPSTLAKRLGGRPEASGLFRASPCDWGYAPNFLTAEPEPDSVDRPFTLETTNRGQVVSVGGWAIDPGAKSPAAKVVATLEGRVVAEATPSGSRMDVASYLRNEGYLRSGFVVGIPLRTLGGAAVSALRIYAISRSGEAAELTYTPESPWAGRQESGPRTLLLGRRRVPVVPGVAEGFADSAPVSDMLLTLDIPQAARDGRTYEWLEIETASPLGDNSFVLSDQAADPGRGITFKSLGRGETKLRVLVGACSQWHGYRSGRLYLQVQANEEIEAVRLYR